MKNLFINDKWHNRWMEMVKVISSYSEDNSTKVGCVIVSKQNDLLSIGWNGLCRGIQNEEYKNERPIKYKFFEHAERNAIYNSSRNGISLKGSTLYVSYWPCCDCTRAIIQSGIDVIVINKDYDEGFKQRWKDDIEISKNMLNECNIEIIEL
jgi:dCMP deaminase